MQLPWLKRESPDVKLAGNEEVVGCATVGVGAVRAGLGIPTRSSTWGSSAVPPSAWRKKYNENAMTARRMRLKRKPEDIGLS